MCADEGGGAKSTTRNDPGPERILRPKAKRDFWQALLMRVGPPLAIGLLMAFAFYCIVIRMCMQQLIIADVDPKMGYIFIAVFLFTNSMFWFSYFNAMFCDPGIVTLEIASRFSDQREENSDSLTGTRFCEYCNQAKPPRAHHCKVCNHCIMKMDHHCGVIDNCVGWKNQKYFILTLVWVSIFLLSGSTMMILKWATHKAPNGWENITEILLYICTFLGTVYGITLAVFAGMHVWFMCVNSTTIEQKHSWSTNSNPFYVGIWKGFKGVCGSNPWLWLLPLPSTPGDGVTWELNPRVQRDV